MAEIGGPLAHQLNPLQSHRGGLVQPSLVMNHHLDSLDNGGGTCHAPNILPSKSFGGLLSVRWICFVGVDMET